MAAQIDAPDIDLRVPLIVVVRFPTHGRYLAGMQAVNGLARTFTDLPEAGAMGRAATRALTCVGG